MLYFIQITSFNIITIILLIILLIICVLLTIKINSLKRIIEILESSKKIDKQITYDKDNTIPIKNISEKSNSNIEENINKETIKNNNLKKNQSKGKIEIYKPNYQNTKKDNKPYSKNILNEQKKTTSPVTINNNEFNVDDYVRNKNRNYLEEVSKSIQKELDSKPIQLTEYEQEEELNAIISYQELLNSKEKEDNNETKEFIDQLKNLRNSLD